MKRTLLSGTVASEIGNRTQVKRDYRWAVGCIAVALSALGRVSAQDGYIFSTLAGKAGEKGSADGAGETARFFKPHALAVTLDGILFVSDAGNATLRRVANGAVTTVAGTAGSTGVSDGPARSAQFGHRPGSDFSLPAGFAVVPEFDHGYGPLGLISRGDGDLWIADTANCLIRRLTRDFVATSLGISPWFRPGATPPPEPSSRDGGAPAGLISAVPHPFGPNAVLPRSSTATFLEPTGMVGNDAGEIFVTDRAANTVRKIMNGGTVSYVSQSALVSQGVAYRTATHAGSVKGHRDGPREIALFSGPSGLAIDRQGALYVADSNNFSIRKIASNGEVTTLAGLPGERGTSDGLGSAARFGGSAQDVAAGDVDFSGGPIGVAVDEGGTVYATDPRSRTIRRIAPDGRVTTIGGAAGLAGSSDGAGHVARFTLPAGIVVDRTGHLFVADYGTHTIRKGTPAWLPRFSTQPESASATVGQAVDFTVNVTGTPAPTLQWTKNGAAIAGATETKLAIAAAGAADAGAYAVTATNELGTTTSSIATLTVGRTPVFTLQPLAQTVAGGAVLRLEIAVADATGATYQWFKDGAPLAGATRPIFIVDRVQAEDAGNYTVSVTNSSGSSTSTAAAITINTSRIVNLSIRSALSSRAQSLTAGFVVSGAGKTLLVRGVGPALAQFGVGGALSDPRIAILAGGSALAANDNWGAAANAAQIAAAGGRVGAFPLGSGGADAALLTSFEGGAYSAVVSGAPGSGGVVLVELYDAEPATAARLVNVSTRAWVGTGDEVLVAGFVVAGNARKSLLIRAVGPTLAAFGVSGTLADPQLEVIAAGQSVPMATNDNWGGGAALTAAFAARGAFPLAASESRDAALVVSLEPGSYSAKVTGVGGATGEALIEIYEIP